ncbi:MAG TPA: GIY-YIG nuclease family protein [Alphaproteobacteria bacterium]|nr:GIY-YIG nuclease family protein [Alphaproteobacteria bacterium]
MKQGFVYIMASRKNGTLYTGVTSNLFRRIFEHKNDLIQGFTKKYGVHRLVYYEVHETMEAAIHREKCIKEWQRQWKIDVIEKFNPTWKDLYLQLAA